jgi:hypothetical protein
LTITGFPVRLFKKGFGLTGTVCTEQETISKCTRMSCVTVTGYMLIKKNSHCILWTSLVHLQ